MILSTQVNSARGLDLLLPGNVVLHSSCDKVDDRMRYSDIEPNIETDDISDIVENEWRGEMSPGHKHSTSGDDLLHVVLRKDGLNSKLEHVLSQFKHEKGAFRAPMSQTRPL